jgi:hypothetical protein
MGCSGAIHIEHLYFVSAHLSRNASGCDIRHRMIAVECRATFYQVFAMSEIDPPTVQAYRKTDYCVDAPEPFVLRVGVASAPLAQLYRRHGTNCCAFITACNPYSRIVGDDANAARQLELAQELHALGLIFFDSIGRHPEGGWPTEPGFLILGLPLAIAKTLGEKFEQNAILCCGPDAVPELILLR